MYTNVNIFSKGKLSVPSTYSNLDEKQLAVETKKVNKKQNLDSIQFT